MWNQNPFLNITWLLWGRRACILPISKACSFDDVTWIYSKNRVGRGVSSSHCAKAAFMRSILPLEQFHPWWCMLQGCWCHLDTFATTSWWRPGLCSLWFVQCVGRNDPKVWDGWWSTGSCGSFGHQISALTSWHSFVEGFVCSLPRIFIWAFVERCLTNFDCSKVFVLESPVHKTALKIRRGYARGDGSVEMSPRRAWSLHIFWFFLCAYFASTWTISIRDAPWNSWWS